MNLDFTAEDIAFRDEVRAFLREHLPPALSEKVRTGKHITKEDMVKWHAILESRHWLASHWPVEWGGPGWSVTQRYIFDVEIALANAPRIAPFGVNMLGPVLLKYGSDEQRKRWLPRILDGSDWWCQGYSEPGAGSDLANLKTQALRDGDHYVVNGQKTWTTLGKYADMIFCLVRTDPSAKKQKGISFLLDRHEDSGDRGPSDRPSRRRRGGERGLLHRRARAGGEPGRRGEHRLDLREVSAHLRAHQHRRRGRLDGGARSLKEIAQVEQKDGKPLALDPLFAARLARVEIELENMKTTSLRVLAAAAHGGAPGAESSMLKIRGTEIRQEISSLARRALGVYAQPFVAEALDDGFAGEPIGPEYAAPFASQYFNQRKLSIFGGSNEIQREIITKTILEL